MPNLNETKEQLCHEQAVRQPAGSMMAHCEQLQQEKREHCRRMEQMCEQMHREEKGKR